MEDTMTNQFCFAVAGLMLAALAAPGLASAADVLNPLEPRATTIGDRQAVVYYVAQPDGYQVVVTFAASTPDTGVSMRSTVTLQPGQHHIVSIAGEAGTAPATLDIARAGDRVTIDASARVGNQAALN